LSSEVDYSNASVGFHPYATYRIRHKLCDALGLSSLGGEARVRQLFQLIETLRSAYPVVMTELAPNVAGAPGNEFLATMETMGISWGFLGGQGFTDADSGQTYGPPGNRISVCWAG
jgi:hypothetical protein